MKIPDDEYAKYASEERLAPLTTKMLRADTGLVAPHEVMACVPGSNGRGAAREWVRIFSMLGNQVRAAPLRTKHRAAAPQRAKHCAPASRA